MNDRLMRLTFVANSNQPEFSYDYKEFRGKSVGPSPNDPKVPVLNPELDQLRQIEG